MKRQRIWKFWYEDWAIWIKGDTWISTIRLCKSIDGKFDVRGKVQPYFGYYRDTVNHVSYPDKYTKRTNVQTLVNVWMPFVFFWFQRNDLVQIETDKPAYIINRE